MKLKIKFNRKQFFKKLKAKREKNYFHIKFRIQNDKNFAVYQHLKAWLDVCR